MEDSYHLSDTDDSAVEDLISQAKDLCILEQVSAINCSSFTDSVLPSELESRFRRLKSFPLTKPDAASASVKRSVSSKLESDSENLIFSPSETNKGFRTNSDSESLSFPSSSKKLSDSKRNSGKEKRVDLSTPLSISSESEELDNVASKQKRLRGQVSRVRSSRWTSRSTLSSSSSSSRNAVFLASKHNRDEKKKRKKNRPEVVTRRKSSRSPSVSSNSAMTSLSPSPPRSGGCLFCSPRRIFRKKSKERDAWNFRNNIGDDEMLSEFSVISAKDQKRIVRKTMEEQEKFNREAEKIVRWATQTSARMDALFIDNDQYLK